MLLSKNVFQKITIFSLLASSLCINADEGGTPPGESSIVQSGYQSPMGSNSLGEGKPFDWQKWRGETCDSIANSQLTLPILGGVIAATAWGVLGYEVAKKREGEETVGAFLKKRPIRNGLLGATGLGGAAFGGASWYHRWTPMDVLQGVTKFFSRDSLPSRKTAGLVGAGVGVVWGADRYLTGRSVDAMGTQQKSHDVNGVAHTVFTVGNDGAVYEVYHDGTNYHRVDNDQVVALDEDGSGKIGGQDVVPVMQDVVDRQALPFAQSYVAKKRLVYNYRWWIGGTAAGLGAVAAVWHFSLLGKLDGHLGLSSGVSSGVSSVASNLWTHAPNMPTMETQRNIALAAVIATACVGRESVLQERIKGKDETIKVLEKGQITSEVLKAMQGQLLAAVGQVQQGDQGEEE